MAPRGVGSRSIYAFEVLVVEVEAVLAIGDGCLLTVESEVRVLRLW